MRALLHFGLGLLIIGIFASCQSTEKMLDNGDYDALIRFAQRKISGKKNKKAKYVRALEEGFAKVIARDMDRINQLKVSNDPDDWEKILYLADRIASRQQKLEPFLPLIDNEGHQAHFEFVKTHEITQYAEGQVVQRLYEDGVEHMSYARNGNKEAAQSAYRDFQKIFEYSDHYKNVDYLMDEARELGIVRVRIVLQNEVREWLPAYVAASLTESFYVEDRFWTQYTFDNGEDMDADFEAALVITDISVGHETIHEEEIVRTKKIEDGFEYVLDENGNVKKDTLGNDIKETKYVKVKGFVVKTHQEKIAHIRARVKIRDLDKGVVIDSRPLHAESRFYHIGQSHYGDQRALNKEDKRFIGLLPFPSNDEMILQASERLKPIFIKEIERNRLF